MTDGGQSPQIVVRPEVSADVEAVRILNEAAFDSDEEAKLVDALRAHADGFVSLVACEADTVVGHVACSPVALNESYEHGLMGLGPMCVLPRRQREGIGTRLVEAALETCASMQCPAVVVIGHAAYYPRFGFVPASRFGLRCQWDVPDDVFLVRRLTPNALQGRTGTIRYHPAFGSE